MPDVKTAGDGDFENAVIDLIPALRAYARSLSRNPTDADDLVQETLLRAIQYVDNFRAGTNLRAWLFTILRNRFYTGIRKTTREPVGAEDCVAGMATSAPMQDLHMEMRDVERAFIRLPQPYRSTMAYVVLREESYDSAARHFNCDIGTIKSRINRGRRLIRAAMADQP